MATILNMAEILGWLGLSSPSDQQLAVLHSIHKGVEQAIVKFCRTNLVQQTFTEYYPTEQQNPVRTTMVDVDAASQFVSFGVGAGEILQLRNVPVRSITSIYEQAGALAGQAPDAFPASTLLTSGVHYWMQKDGPGGMSATGFVRRRSGSWCSEVGSIKVTYVAGFSDAELNGTDGEAVDASDIKLAARIAFGHYWNKHVSQASGLQGGIKTSESLGDYSYTLGGDFAGTKFKIPNEARDLLNEYVHYGK